MQIFFKQQEKWIKERNKETWEQEIIKEHEMKMSIHVINYKMLHLRYLKYPWIHIYIHTYIKNASMYRNSWKLKCKILVDVFPYKLDINVGKYKSH